MDPSIQRINPGARYAPRPVADRERQREREFVIPSQGGEDEEEDVVIEPQPRRDLGDLAISRERLEDEAGHNLDVQG